MQRVYSGTYCCVNVLDRAEIPSSLLSQLDDMAESQLDYYCVIEGKGVVGMINNDSILWIVALAGLGICNMRSIVDLVGFAKSLGCFRIRCVARDLPRERLYKKLGFKKVVGENYMEILI